jgi:hypothetical protein
MRRKSIVDAAELVFDALAVVVSVCVVASSRYCFGDSSACGNLIIGFKILASLIPIIL